ncbi:MoxR family ATPase [bacterium]|jgi:hypothetical protein|nr:MoxR family ATPase [bacterium]|tara:strand:+ start:1957 stop:3063 length:1107 start_codon:yes stop_codon:yes gene_type:complete
METLNVRAKSVKPILLRALKVNRPIFIWGAPGIGKSELVEGLVSGGDLGNAMMIDLRLALLEPTDLRGYPFRNPETNTMEWSPPSDLPSQNLADQYDNIVLFLDELNSAPPSVQAAAYQLVLNRRIGQYILPSNVRIVAAGNRETDRGVTFRMPAPLANRFRHINMEVNFEDWAQWAMQNAVHPDVIGYLSFAKGDLFDFDPKSSSQSFATPRSWNFVSEMLDASGFDEADAFEQKVEIAGAIGEGMAIKFVEHRKIASKLPNPEQIIAGEVKTLDTKLSKEISAKYSLVVGLAYELNEMFKQDGINDPFRKALNNVVRFSYDNFEPEMVVFLFKTIMKDYQIRFNVRTDLEKELHKTFSERYTKYIA